MDKLLQNPKIRALLQSIISPLTSYQEKMLKSAPTSKEEDQNQFTNPRMINTLNYNPTAETSAQTKNPVRTIPAKEYSSDIIDKALKQVLNSGVFTDEMKSYLSNIPATLMSEDELKDFPNTKYGKIGGLARTNGLYPDFIEVNPDMMNDPKQLNRILAHELMHQTPKNSTSRGNIKTSPTSYGKVNPEEAFAETGAFYGPTVYNQKNLSLVDKLKYLGIFK